MLIKESSNIIETFLKIFAHFRMLEGIWSASCSIIFPCYYYKIKSNASQKDIKLSVGIHQTGVTRFDQRGNKLVKRLSSIGYFISF